VTIMIISKYSTDTLNEMYCHLYFKKFNRLPKSSSSIDRKTLIQLVSSLSTKEQVNETVYQQSVL
jgi:DNA-binding HxlR family transcriptional regulator